ncbi:TBC1 domain family member 17 [Orchesella cincta]|uniref:TBC1 domain family member 17 n=1 Tax=Orchesella cincta TaxID=48709 RepID=A0A1D2M3M5_ORCCI|nr:TBC1 domain family member 17 [Orchesella cincta]
MENKFGLSEILRHVNDLAMRIDLESTLTRAEAMYLQISAPEVTDKLPNKLRVILGLPEKEEPLNDAMEIVDANDAASSSQSTPRHSSKTEQGPSTSGAGDGAESNGVRRSSGSDSSLERQYEMGVNQFM